VPLLPRPCYPVTARSGGAQCFMRVLPSVNGPSDTPRPLKQRGGLRSWWCRSCPSPAPLLPRSCPAPAQRSLPPPPSTEFLPSTSFPSIPPSPFCTAAPQCAEAPPAEWISAPTPRGPPRDSHPSALGGLCPSPVEAKGTRGDKGTGRLKVEATKCTEHPPAGAPPQGSLCPNPVAGSRGNEMRGTGAGKETRP